MHRATQTAVHLDGWEHVHRMHVHQHLQFAYSAYKQTVGMKVMQFLHSMHKLTHAHVHMHTHTGTHKHACTHAHRPHTDTHTHTQIHIDTHTHTHTH